METLKASVQLGPLDQALEAYGGQAEMKPRLIIPLALPSSLSGGPSSMRFLITRAEFSATKPTVATARSG
jgi:hypothetical protein